MHYYKFNIGDYKSHTEHLELLEDLAFRRMLDWLYLHEKPLPKNVDEIARMIRMRTHNDCIEYVLQNYFKRIADGWINERVSRELGNYQEKSEKAKKSAEVRWKKNNNENNDLDDANALQTDSERNAKHKTLNTKQETLNNNYKDSFENVWKQGLSNGSKKQALEQFVKKSKSLNIEPEQFSNMLIKDCQARLKLGQFGFDKLHTVRYIRDERWSDELRSPDRHKQAILNNNDTNWIDLEDFEEKYT